jgi:hypothetical protein
LSLSYRNRDVVGRNGKSQAKRGSAESAKHRSEIPGLLPDRSTSICRL